MKPATLITYPNGTAELFCLRTQCTVFAGPVAWVRSQAVQAGYKIIRESAAL